jgi:cyclopropane fatty-acyl-phospholipid synthase-like methyltransferase
MGSTIDYITKAEHLVDFGCEWGGVLNLANNKCKKLSGIELNNNCLDYLNNKFPKSNYF